MTQTRYSNLEGIIEKGREQGYLTYQDIHGRLGEDGMSEDAMADLINTINALGILVLDQAQDPDAMMLNTAPLDDSEAEEAEELIKSLIEGEAVRTSDPMAMYMREIGRRDLLTKSEEVALAKRMEQGGAAMPSSRGRLPRSNR